MNSASRWAAERAVGREREGEGRAGVKGREGRRTQESTRREEGKEGGEEGGREGRREGGREGGRERKGGREGGGDDTLCINNLETVRLNALTNVYIQYHLEGGHRANVSLLLQYRVCYPSTGAIRLKSTHTHTYVQGLMSQHSTSIASALSQPCPSKVQCVHTDNDMGPGRLDMAFCTNSWSDSIQKETVPIKQCSSLPLMGAILQTKDTQG